VTGGVAAALVPALAADAMGPGSLLVVMHPPSAMQPASASKLNLFGIVAPVLGTSPKGTLAQFLSVPPSRCDSAFRVAPAPRSR
jgi:hypothetical protein